MSWWQHAANCVTCALMLWFTLMVYLIYLTWHQTISIMLNVNYNSIPTHYHGVAEFSHEGGAGGGGFSATSLGLDLGRSFLSSIFGGAGNRTRAG